MFQFRLNIILLNLLIQLVYFYFSIFSHMPYELEGVKGMRIKFHLKGQRRSATAHLDAREVS